ncbi:SixA phosphatase family protein [Chelatococcus composti]|jgi:Phosphohistidine phosphatase SixA|uniref:Phosphohistidine phosphatase n=1 Tax=Chelatococcus composti TaxID=1743235 RepID=A0A841K174_9HYPH|nr:histidine phosphatase family protein [Chelatococcus composti]MBB6166468.1 phosphohistidine phosphatase [Chelatococcus composti]MBS7734602.1 histidine phosphatase family protein [Chelatococcus composti]PZN44066.1 MAG: phosphoglycerate mutase [Pseudomonadota bacterium]
MLRLMLLRHAKSAWPAGMADHERPLAPRGREAAPLMGRYLAGEHLVPDLAIVSTARRTQETWDLVAAAFAEVVAKRDEQRIYEAKTDAILAVVRETGPDVRTLLVVGHNPGFADLAVRLVGHGDRYAFAHLRQKFPTAALAVIDFAIDSWADVAEQGGRLDRFITPKMIGGEDED